MPPESHQKSEGEPAEFAKDVASGIRGVFDRVGEFFHLFDLSFFVSGAASLSAVAYWYSRQEFPYKLANDTWLRVTALVVACYVAGLLSFAAGRLLAGFWRGGFRSLFTMALLQHAVADPDISRYLQTQTEWRLYERLWVDLRESPSHAASFTLLNRYWVMSATYDGVAVSCLLWALAVVVAPLIKNGCGNAALSLLFVIAACLAFWQGLNYFRFQIFELIATLASSKRRIIA